MGRLSSPRYLAICKGAACNTKHTHTSLHQLTSHHLAPSSLSITHHAYPDTPREGPRAKRQDIQLMHALLGEMQVLDVLPTSGGKHLNPLRSASRRGRRKAKRPCSLSRWRLRPSWERRQQQCRKPGLRSEDWLRQAAGQGRCQGGCPQADNGQGRSKGIIARIEARPCCSRRAARGIGGTSQEEGQVRANKVRAIQEVHGGEGPRCLKGSSWHEGPGHRQHLGSKAATVRNSIAG